MSCLLCSCLLFTSGCSSTKVIQEATYSIENAFGTMSAEDANWHDVTSPVKIESVSTDRYAYNTLNDGEKVIYDQMLNCVENYMESVSLSTVTEDAVMHSYKAMMADYGELFWLSGYTFQKYTIDDEPAGIIFIPTYTKSEEEKKDLSIKIDAAADAILSDCDADDDYGKAKYIYEYLGNHCEYNEAAIENQNILSVLIYGSSVCQGFSVTAQYLLSKVGIQACTITGHAGDVPHAWTLMKLDGNYYYMDSTWSGSTYDDGSSGGIKYINYNYFALTEKDFDLKHTPSDIIDMPTAVSMDDNYYVKEGLYITDWNENSIGNLLGNAYSNGNKVFTLRFSDENLYNQFLSTFIQNGKITSYCSVIQQISYQADQGLHTVTCRF